MDAKETTLLTAILIAGITIGAIILYFFISLVRHHRRNQEVYKSKIKAEIAALENERSRIAADLHDELGPLLSSVKLKMNCLDIPLPEDQQLLVKINKHIDDVMSRMREISNDLLPTSLVRKGLFAALEESIDKLNSKNSLKIWFEYKGDAKIDQHNSIHIYRITQEIIHNTIKHSGASLLKINIESGNHKLVLTTDDDGIGFDSSKAVKEHAGLGLRNLLSRTELMKGEMFINTAPGKGTHYIFEFPLRQNAEHHEK